MLLQVTQSPALRNVVVVLVCYGAYTAWQALNWGAWGYLLAWTVPCAVAAAGLAFGRPWAQWLHYLIAGMSVLGWLMVLINQGSAVTADQLYRLLLTGAIMGVVAGWTSYTVWRYFHPPGPQLPSPSKVSAGT